MTWTPEQVEQLGRKLKGLRDTELFCLLLDLGEIISEFEHPLERDSRNS